jgi:long chain fatty acid CoA FadD26
MVVVRGVNHSLEEIEQVATNAHPQLIGCAAAAFRWKDEAGEQLVILQEAPRPWQGDAERKALRDAICEHVTARFGIRPADVKIVAPGTLPRTRNGKLRRDVNLASLRTGDALEIG